MKIKKLVLGRIETDVCKKIFVGKLLTRSISVNFRHESWQTFTNFQTISSILCNFRDDLRCNFSIFSFLSFVRKSEVQIVEILQNHYVQKMLPHTKNPKKILGFLALRAKII